MNVPKPATPLRIAGEVQMKVIQHDMTILCRTNERLLAERAELIEALRKCAARYPGDTYGDFADASALLRKIEGNK